ncbi:hypothetical protein CSB11_00840 [Candidatus Campbellbacteria bacterium]|nr:MAG: hypothetical protein CSB11_00840 [Candidatus Campbellbacteria bacterium]
MTIGLYFTLATIFVFYVLVVALAATTKNFNEMNITMIIFISIFIVVFTMVFFYSLFSNVYNKGIYEQAIETGALQKINGEIDYIYKEPACITTRNGEIEVSLGSCEEMHNKSKQQIVE